MDEYLIQENIQEAKLVAKKVKEIFADKGEEVDDEDIENIKEGDIPENPPFPGFILLLALLKDGVDAGDITIIGVVFTTIFSFITTIILFFWTFNKIKHGYFKKKFLKRTLWLLAGTVLVEWIPLLKIIPTESIYVLLVHFRQKKIVRLFDLALEEIYKLEKMRKLNISERLPMEDIRRTSSS